MTSVEDEPHTEESVLGAVLAGGESRRLGRDKARLPFQGRTLIEHVAHALGQVFEEVTIVTGPAHRHDFLGLPVVPDTIPGCGPLGGIYTALEHAGGRPVFVAACDLPFVNAELIRFVLDFSQETGTGTSEQTAIAETAVAKVPARNQRRQPLCALYSPRCLPVIARRLEEGKFGVIDFLKEIETVLVPISSDLSFYAENLLFNVNTPEDYEKMCKNQPT